MKDKYGKRIGSGTMLLKISGACLGQIEMALAENGELVFPDCSLTSCSVPLSGLRIKDGCLQDYIVIRDPHRKIGYVEAAKIWKNLDLAGAGILTEIPDEELSDEQKAILMGLWGEESDPGSYYCDPLEICDAWIEPGINVFGYTEHYWDDETAEYILHNFIKKAEHYLVFAAHSTWNGASGYKIGDDVCDIVKRSYDAHITPVQGTPGGKILILKESSHDVPMGSTTIAVALTEKEYEKLKNADFGTVEAFAEAAYDSAMKRKK